MFGYLRHHRAKVAAIGVCTIVQALVGVAPVLLVKMLVDDLQHPHEPFGHIAALGAAGVGLIVVGGLVGVLRTWLVLSVRTSVMADLREQLAGRLLGQSVSYFTDNRGGELMSRVMNDVAVVEGMLESALSVATNVVAGAACVIAMFLLEWRLALVTLTIVPVVVLTLRQAGRPIYRSRMRVQEQLAALTAHLQESLSLSGIMLIKSFGREEADRDQMVALNQSLRRSQLEAGMTARWVGLVFGVLGFAGPACVLLVGAWLVANGDITLATLVAFVTVLGLRVGQAAAGLGNGVSSFVGALPACQRIFEVLDGSVEIQERPGALALVDAGGAVQLEGVTFTYSGRSRPALEDVSLDIPPGQLVALVGPSGAGKTTLSTLVPRFYDPQQGFVRIDGHDVRDLTLASLGRATGLVLQETYLFHGSLRQNLLYARPDATADEIKSACADAQLQDVVAGLPDGLDTVVGERGHRLSGGEKQRVAIARVILKDPPVLILDEATSHLDSVSEQLVQLALSRLFRDRTSIVIAHRLSTVRAADLIVVLDAGRVVERGTHDELVAAGGLYRTLYETQFRSGRGQAVTA